MASPAKRRRVSPAKAQPARSNSGSGNSGSSSHQPSVLNFFGAAASSPSKPPEPTARDSSREGTAADTDEDVILLDVSRRPAGGPGANHSVASSSSSSHRLPGSPGRSDSLSKKEANVPCPICGRPFPYRQIAAHASSCLDFQAPTSPDPAPVASGSGSSFSARPSATSPAAGALKSPELPSGAPQARALRSATPLFEASNSATANALPQSTAVEPATTSANVFTHLMKSHATLKQWASADAAEAKNAAVKGRPHTSSPRSVPFYKIVTGTPISVDAFRFGKIEGCTAYFLTHFHGDHYGGLSANWRWGYIYGSRTTCELVKSHLGVHPKWVRELPMEEKTLIEDTGGVSVTLVDANHCPGSCLFLFEGPQTVDILRPGQSRFFGKKHFRALHCGDFRASPRHTNHPLVLGIKPAAGPAEIEAPLLNKTSGVSSSVKSLFGPQMSGSASVHDGKSSSPAAASPSAARTKALKLDTVYLDTTYLNPRYCFPAQEEVVQACADLVLREATRLQGSIQAAALKKGGNSPTREEGSFIGSSLMSSWLTGAGTVKSEDPEPSSEPSASAPSSRSTLNQSVNSTDLRIKEEHENDDLHVSEERLFDAEMMEDMKAADDGMVHSLLDDFVKAEPDDPFGGDPAPVLMANASDVKKAKSFLSWLPSKPANPNGRRKDRLLVLVGTYTIGKEKIVKACARALQTRIFCPSPRKYDVYGKLEDPELHELLTRDPAEADVFVTNLSAINGQGLHDLVAELRTQGHDIKRAIAFRPTGWTYKPPAGIDTTAPDLRRLIAWNQSRTFGPDRLFPTRDSSREYQIYGVPYSEHSSFFELTAFALSLDYDRIIATVNVGNPASRAKMEKWFERWMIEKKRRQKAGEPDRLPSRTLDYW
ncbi:DNA cross-link repair protein PSO2/SNM1 [Tilletia horrida]|uniref:DNA cross-link repair protein PSO2/SNM1 n=1 Tax=Tilletia horrida TaxID=155126 RepID=A0AAN6GCT0_9BASI|nr:DNA cross-link repair protein PSO2/SNM1 [Tilletia horrida]